MPDISSDISTFSLRFYCSVDKLHEIHEVKNLGIIDKEFCEKIA